MAMMSMSRLETNAHREVKMLFWTTFASTKGANNRIRIIEELQKRPHNLHQLSKDLNLDYKTIQHHMRVLETNNLISKISSSYPTICFISPLLETNMETFEEIRTNTSQS